MNTKSISITHEFLDDYYIKSDYYLVSIIISNIISNAIKYTNEKGQIKITLSKIGIKTICVISDNGIGIPTADLDKIVNPFFRSNSILHPDIKGCGLGLSIVDRITQLLNIKMKIESEVNTGTKVFLNF